MTTRGQDSLLQDAARALADPVGFARAFLSADPWSAQEAILRSVDQNQRTTVKACHSSGKTHIAAEAALWWLARWPGEGIVITTAPTWTQVEQLLWGQIKMEVAKSKWPFPEPQKTYLEIGPQNYALGLSTNEGDRFQGFHGKILIIVDEATGVKEQIYNAIDGIAAGGDVRILLLGNPTRASGRFYETFRYPGWSRITIDAFDSPNFEAIPGGTATAREAWMRALPVSWSELTGEQRAILDFAPRPYLTKPRWAWEKGNEWGWDSAIFQSRVRGQFPVESDDQLFSLSDLEMCRLEIDEEGGDYQCGIDVAGPGEAESVMYFRRGANMIGPHTTRASDPRGFFANRLVAHEGIELVRVDAVGIGYHVWTHLRDLLRPKGIPVVKVIGQERNGVDRRFANLRAEIAWTVRDEVRSHKIGGLADDVTIAQLLSLRYYHDTSGRIALVSKEEMVKKGLKSPDRADAFLMTRSGPRHRGLTCY